MIFMYNLGEVPSLAFHQHVYHGLLSAVSRFRVDYILLRLVFVQKTGEYTVVMAYLIAGKDTSCLSCVPDC